jgi:hypothetical protein
VIRIHTDRPATKTVWNQFFLSQFVDNQIRAVMVPGSKYRMPQRTSHASARGSIGIHADTGFID